MAPRTLVHEVSRAALQRLDILDIGAGIQQRNFPFFGQRGAGAEESKGD
jgi:hypothetical protein